MMAAATVIPSNRSVKERPPLVPDLDQARRFLTLLDEDAAKFTFQMATDAEPGDKPRPDPLARHVNLSPDNLRALARHNALFRDLCRVMRVPGFWHQKDPARPFRVRIAHQDARLPYQPADVLGAFPPASEGPKPNGRDTGASFLGLPPVPPDPLDHSTLETLQADHPDVFDLGRYDGDQSRQDLALASLARRVGWPPVDAWRLIIAVRGDSKSIRRDYIERTLQKAYDQQADADPVAPDAEGDAKFDLSHDGLALDMGRRWQRDARHVALWGKWMFWTGARWEPDEKLAHLTRTRNYLRARADSLVRTAAKGKIQGFDVDKAEALAKQLRSAPMVTNVVGLARSNEG